jgi:hypothetical protein
LAHKYKPIVQKEIEAMLVVGIIYLIDKSEWEIPMVMQPKKHDPKKLRICVDFRGLNKLTVTDPFPMPFVDEIINEVAGHECYSFTDGLLWIQSSTYKKGISRKNYIFSEFGSFAYKVMSFGLKNAPIVFSRIVVKAFQEYIYKTMVVYFDDWTIYNLLKDHIQWLRMMLERCRKIQLYLNIKKCIFSTPIGILLGHIVCKDGIKVDMAKIKIILDLKPPVN